MSHIRSASRARPGRCGRYAVGETQSELPVRSRVPAGREHTTRRRPQAHTRSTVREPSYCVKCERAPRLRFAPLGDRVTYGPRAESRGAPVLCGPRNSRDEQCPGTDQRRSPQSVIQCWGRFVLVWAVHDLRVSQAAKWSARPSTALRSARGPSICRTPRTVQDETYEVRVPR